MQSFGGRPGGEIGVEFGEETDEESTIALIRIRITSRIMNRNGEPLAEEIGCEDAVVAVAEGGKLVGGFDDFGRLGELV